MLFATRAAAAPKPRAAVYSMANFEPPGGMGQRVMANGMKSICANGASFMPWQRCGAKGSLKRCLTRMTIIDALKISAW